MKATVVKDKEYGDLYIVFDTPGTWRGCPPDILSCWGLFDWGVVDGGCSAGYVKERTLSVDGKYGKALLERYIQRYYNPDGTYEYLSRKQFLNHVTEAQP